MPITSIGRYFVGNPNIVGVITTDNFAAITAAGYLTTQAENIRALNQGDFDWATTDLALIFYATNNIGFFVRDPIANTFVDNGGGQIPLNNGNILVGNASNIATGVTPSGDISLTNTGLVTIVPNAVTTAKILNANVTLAKLSSGITPSHVIKFAGKITTTGGSNVENFTVTGAVAATDIVITQMINSGSNSATILTANINADNNLNMVFDLDPSNNAIFSYQIIRPAS